MENKVNERSTAAQTSNTQPKAEAKNTPTRMPWVEQEILALQEKARDYQRRYPAGGYQGL